jgi:hypothetical protein
MYAQVITWACPRLSNDSPWVTLHAWSTTQDHPGLWDSPPGPCRTCGVALRSMHGFGIHPQDHARPCRMPEEPCSECLVLIYIHAHLVNPSGSDPAYLILAYLISNRSMHACGAAHDMVRSRANIHKSHARTAQVCCCVLNAGLFCVGIIATMQDPIRISSNPDWPCVRNVLLTSPCPSHMYVALPNARHAAC